MTQETIVTELKGLFSDMKKFLFEKSPEPVQKFMMNGTLDDGTPVMIDGDKPTIGAIVTVMSTEGVESPIADGEYIVKIGEESVTIKTSNGAITESSVKAIEDELKPEEPKAEEMANEKITEIENRLKALEEGATAKADATAVEAQSNEVREITVKMQSQIDALTSENKELRDNTKKMIDSVELLLNKPIEKPTYTPETYTSEDKIAEFKKKYINQ